MKRWPPALIAFFLLLIPLVAPAHEEGPLKIVAVGDTGIGERAYHAGFLAVQETMRRQGADVLLHLGDFVYQPKLFPDSCPMQYLQEIRMTLVRPYPVRVFVAGDNDLRPKKWKPKASGCWSGIGPMASPYDTLPAAQPQPRELEGAVRLGHALIAVVNAFPWADPTPWLKPLIDSAKEKGDWVIVATHNPPITTIWYQERRRERLDLLKELGVDLILSGNEHSYERFSPPGGADPSDEPRREYEKGEGPVLIVSGGGGATFKPPAEIQGDTDHLPPADVAALSEVRELVNHFVQLEIDDHAIQVKTHRVCAGPDAEGDPRWKPRAAWWTKITLPCEGQPKGTKVFDEFVIRKNKD